MMSYQQQAELARLQHEARLAAAAQERRFAHLRQRPTLPLATWLHWLGEQRRTWFAPSRLSTGDRIAAVRHQTSYAACDEN